MRTRIVWTKIWKDDWFQSLSDQGQKLFLYLITNENIAFSGCFQLSNYSIKSEARIKEIEKTKNDLYPKVKFYKDWVYVCNSECYNSFRGSSEVAKEKELTLIPLEIFNTLIKGKDEGGLTDRLPIVNPPTITNTITNININTNKDYMESITPEIISEIANKYLVPESFVKSKLEDIELWEGEKPGRMKGRNWKLTLINWVKRDALKIKGDYAKQNQYRGIDASNI